MRCQARTEQLRRPGVDGNGEHRVQAVFSLDGAGALTVVVNDGRWANTTTPVNGTFNGTAHRYRVDYAGRSVAFFVDGSQVASSPFQPSVAGKVVASDVVRDSTSLAVDWVRAGTYDAPRPTSPP